MFEVILYKSIDEIYDVSELVVPVDFTDNINQAGVVTFGMLRDWVLPAEGNGIVIIHDYTTYFSGFIFKTGHSQSQEIKVTAYDRMRYLKTNDTYVFKDKTAGEIVKHIANDFGLPTGIIEDTKYPLGTMIFDNKGLLDMVADCVTKTLTATKKLYFLKDNAGKLEFRNILSCVSDLQIDPESLLYGYSYERDIDSDTYNQIKLVRDNKSTGKREIYMAKDSNSIKRWGLLQHYEKVDDDMNPEQIKEKADALLYLKNRVKQTLNLDVLGEKTIRAGNMIYVSIPEVGVSKYLLCTCAKHRFTNTAHTVKVDLKLV